MKKKADETYHVKRSLRSNINSPKVRKIKEKKDLSAISNEKKTIKSKGKKRKEKSKPYVRQPEETKINREPVTEYSCFFCEHKTRFIRELRKHSLTMHGRKWIGCVKCNIAMASPKERAEHLDSCLAAVTCDFCSIRMEGKGVLLSHICSKHLGVKQKPYTTYIQCPSCGKMRKGKDNLEKHIFRYHKELVDTLPEKFKCSRCFFRTGNAQTLEHHEKNHSLRHMCHICGKSFHANWYLVWHQNVHSGYKPIQCPLCDKTFTNPPYLRAHLKVHKKNGSSVRSKTCPVCLGRFTAESFADHEAFCVAPPPPLTVRDFAQ